MPLLPVWFKGTGGEERVCPSASLTLGRPPTSSHKHSMNSGHYSSQHWDFCLSSEKTVQEEASPCKNTSHLKTAARQPSYNTAGQHGRREGRRSSLWKSSGQQHACSICDNIPANSISDSNKYCTVQGENISEQLIWDPTITPDQKRWIHLHLALNSVLPENT